MRSSGFKLEPGTRVVVRSIVYYAILITVTTFTWSFLPRSSFGLPPSLDTLFGGREAAGKKLDFLSQEMLREINTMGSKSRTASIRTLVVELKTEVERIREQVQNVE